MEYLESINPYTGDLIEKHEVDEPRIIDEKLSRSEKIQRDWARSDPRSRVELLKKVADTLERNKEEYGKLITLEMGKVIGEAVAEIEKCAWLCRYYAENGPSFLQEEKYETDFKKTKVSFQPLGIILIVMPWNFPFWQAFRAAAPAILAGNSVVLKHASNVMGSAKEIEKVFLEAGAPEGLFTSLIIPSSSVEQVLDYPAVRSVSLTGSEKAGASVASLAGARIKKSVLELGGSDPYIVLDDADIQKAVDVIKQSRLYNGGQSCISAKRMIVVEQVYEEFLHHFVEAMSSAQYGDPMDESNVYGPMARLDLRDQLYDQQQRAIAAGAQLITGGFIPDGPGALYPPTVLAEVKPGQAAFDEELFGPVAAVIRATDTNNAIHLANLSDYGLGAAVFTEDREKGERLATEMVNAGSVFVNSLVRSDPRLPFGGVKLSGYGREMSRYGLMEFVNIKTISIN